MLSLSGLIWVLALVACDKDEVQDSESYHPAGWAAAGVHGQAAKMHEQTCTNCHGSTLEGASDAASCDSCHPSAWREDCSFCHGSAETPAPPESFDDTLVDQRFPHPAHVNSPGDNGHAAYSCDTCHQAPTDFLDVGHLFDESPGRAETDLSRGVSAQGAWDAETYSCSNTWCHGDGQKHNGSVAADDGTRDCGDCHGDANSSNSLSGEHNEHVRHKVECQECHSTVVSGDSQITGPELHVDGSVQVVIEDPNITMNDELRCEGACHGENHRNERW